MDRHIEAFLEMLAAERGAARNTLLAYRTDLEDFAAFAAAHGASNNGQRTATMKSRGKRSSTLPSNRGLYAPMIFSV